MRLPGTPNMADLVPWRPDVRFIHAVAPPKDDVVVLLDGAQITLVDAAQRGTDGWVRHYQTADDRLDMAGRMATITVDVGSVEFWVKP